MMLIYHDSKNEKFPLSLCMKNGKIQTFLDDVNLQNIFEDVFLKEEFNGSIGAC